MLFSHTPHEVNQNRAFYLHSYDPSNELVRIDRVMNWYELFKKLKKVLSETKWPSLSRSHHPRQNFHDPEY